MRVLLAIWHEEIAVFFKEKEYVQMLPSLARDEAGRGLLFIEVGKGSYPAIIEQTRYEDGSCRFPWHVRAKREDGCEFARCSGTPVSLHMTNPDLWEATLPLDHEFNWPKPRDCNLYERKQELMNECILRRDSAKKCGVTMPPVPANVQKLLTPEMRVALFS